MTTRHRSRRSTMTEAVQLIGFDANDDASQSEIEDEDDPHLRDESDDASSLEDDSSEDAPVNGRWRVVNTGADSVRNEPEFRATTGLHPHIQVPGDIKDKEHFFLDHFFNDILLQEICDHTNNRIWQDLVDDPENEKLKNCKQVNINDIKKFIGLLILMTLNKKPTLGAYWSGDIVFSQQIFSTPESLSRDRFQLILKYIRFADPENLENDYLAKVRPFVEKVNDLCQNTYLPDRQISIDETLMLFKGRLRIRQYIPSKRKRYGLKSYVLAESESGYVWKFMLHGLSTENRAIGLTYFGADELSVSERIVVELSHDLFHQGYHIYIDNFYTSFRLCQYLFDHGTLMTGTVKPNRGVPNELKQLNVPVKSQAHARNGDILLYVSNSWIGNLLVKRLFTWWIPLRQQKMLKSVA